MAELGTVAQSGRFSSFVCSIRNKHGYFRIYFSKNVSIVENWVRWDKKSTPSNGRLKHLESPQNNPETLYCDLGVQNITNMFCDIATSMPAVYDIIW